jgi:hypothetical protein
VRGYRRRQAACRQASEHQRRRPAGVNGWPQAGHEALSLRLSSRDGITAPGGWLAAARQRCARDQAGQQHYRPAGVGAGKLGRRHCWRRIQVRQQTELDRLHEIPPWQVVFVQPAPVRSPRRRATP